MIGVLVVSEIAAGYLRNMTRSHAMRHSYTSSGTAHDQSTPTIAPSLRYHGTAVCRRYSFARWTALFAHAQLASNIKVSLHGSIEHRASAQKILARESVRYVNFPKKNKKTKYANRCTYWCFGKKDEKNNNYAIIYRTFAENVTLFATLIIVQQILNKRMNFFLLNCRMHYSFHIKLQNFIY